jgi:cysteine desulfurase
MTTAFGNANSVEHVYGEVASALVTDARRVVAELVHADPEGVHFTAGSSDSIRFALAHAVAGRGQRPLRVAVTTVEHRAVLDAIAVHARRGEVTVRWLPVDGQARLDMATLEAACHDGIDLVCVMAANNEVGTCYPVAEICRIAGQSGALTLIDATQAAGRVSLHASDWGITYLTISAHKLYGPKGVGALIVPPELEVRPSHGHTPGRGRERQTSRALPASVKPADSGALRWPTTSPASPPGVTGSRGSCLRASVDWSLTATVRVD